jgi:hypothetical protein
VPIKCSECKHLIQVFESRLADFVKARAAPFFRVSSELAAKKKVDMERARSDVEEHRLAWHVGPHATDPRDKNTDVVIPTTDTLNRRLG